MSRRPLLLIVCLAGLATLLPDRYSLTTFHEANSAGRIYAVQSWTHYDRWCFQDILCKSGPRHSVLDMSLSEGRPCLQKAPGLSWLAVPIYGALSGIKGDRLSFHGAAWWLSLLCVWLPLLLAALALGRWLRAQFDDHAALFAVATLLLASPLMVYSGLFMDYGLAVALLIGALIALRRDGPLALAGGGLLLGAAVTVNYMCLIYGGLIGLFELVDRWRRDGPPRALRAAGLILVGALPPIVALLVYHDALWGSPWSTPYDHLNPVFAQRMDNVGFDPAGLVSGLVDPKTGLLFYAPWAAFGVAGLIRLVRDPEHPERRFPALAGLSILAATLLFNAVWVTAHPGDAPFNRHMLPALPFLVWGLAAFLQRSVAPSEGTAGRWAWLRGAAYGSVAIAALYQLITAWSFPYHFGDLESPMWQVSFPLFVSGVHVESVFERLMDHNGEDSFGWILVALALTCAAFLVAWMRREAHERRAAWAAFVAFIVCFALGLASGSATERSALREDQAKTLVLESKWSLLDAQWREEGHSSNPWCQAPQPELSPPSPR